jgi:hypothetical protein
MRKAFMTLPAFALAVVISVPGAAEVLSCRSLNGDIICSGSRIVSCETVNGQTLCANDADHMVQFLRARHTPGPQGHDPGDIPDEAADDDSIASNTNGGLPWTDRRVSVRRTGWSGFMLSVGQHLLRLWTESTVRRC